MSENCGSLFDLVAKDPRYPLDAYLFVRESLAYASDTRELGACSDPQFANEEELLKARRERHLTGQQLCEAIREYALNQFGYMAKVVLKSWNVTETKCFGDIVYNLISIGEMKKSSEDHPSHFNDVYDFEEAFDSGFEICNSSIAQRRS